MRPDLRYEGPMPVPLWVRALLTADKVMTRAHDLAQVVRDETLFAFLPEERRRDLTSHLYDADGSYVGGDALSGLFDFERDILDHPAVPRTGRVLLGGAGGGRELRELAGRGYEVVGFEPSQVLATELARVAEGYAGCRGLRASYEDLPRAATGEGPLAGLGAFDLVWFGWGSLTHVTEIDEIVRVLRAAREVAPGAVLAATVGLWLDSSQAMGGLRKERSRALLRSVYAKVGGRPPPPVSYRFFPSSGFSRLFTRRELEGAVADAGWDLVRFDEGAAYAWVLLGPPAG